MKKKIVILLSLVLCPVVSLAYEPTQTHAGLTEQVVEFYNITAPDTKKITDEQKELMIKGAMEEDEPSSRAINHFYDPVRSIGIESYRTAKDWALVDSEWNQYSWGEVIDFYAKGNEREAFIGLGHIVHLIEDMGVPDHTRNDQHLPFLDEEKGGHSPYEDWAMTEKNRQTMQGLARQLSSQGFTEKTFGGLGTYFDFLANYSNRNFFSRDTIVSSVYKTPSLDDVEGEYVLVFDSLSNKKEQNLLTWKKRSGERFYALSDDFGYKSVLPSYFDRLSRQIVPAGSGVITLFFKEGEVARAAYLEEERIRQEAELAEAEAILARARKQTGFFGAIASINDGMKYIIKDSVITPVKDIASSVSRGSVKLKKVATQEPYHASKLAMFTGQMAYTAGKEWTEKKVEEAVDATGEVVVFVQKTIDDFLQESLAVVTGDTVEKNHQLTQAQEIAGNSNAGAQVQNPTTSETPEKREESKKLAFANTQTGVSSFIGFGGGSPAQPVAPAETQQQDVSTSDSTTPSAQTQENTTTEQVTEATSETSTQSETSEETQDTTPETSPDTTTPAVSENSDTQTEESTTEEGTTEAIVPASEPVIPDTTAYADSDLNVNGINDREESDVVMTESLSLPAGEYFFKNLTISNNAVLTLDGDAKSINTFKGVKITATNITIEDDASISAKQKVDSLVEGFGTPSLDAYNAGASYGGVGYGNATGSTYGSAERPTDLGSIPRTAHAYPGGAVFLVVTDTLKNEGTISANGINSASGGSVYVTTKNLTGAGMFQANSSGVDIGSTISGVASGGRVAIHYQTSTFSGDAEALGACVRYDGWSFTCAEDGTIGLIDTKNNDLYITKKWRFQAGENPTHFNHVYLSGDAKVTADTGAHINTDELVLSGSASFVLPNTQGLRIPKVAMSGSATLTLSGVEFSADSVVLSGNATLTVLPEQKLLLTTPHLTIGAGSTVTVNNTGYKTEEGPGAPTGGALAGASHGGVGYPNASASPVYGSAEDPVLFGSGGGAPRTHGGGAMRLVVSGDILNDGTISADGDVSSSGGSIYISTGNLAGSGSIHANGGGLYVGGYFAGPGGGGRVAVYTQTSTFSGNTESLGGCGRYDGWTTTCAGDGTVHVVDQSKIEEETTAEAPASQSADVVAPVISRLVVSSSSNSKYTKIGDVVTLSITADASGYLARAVTVNSVAVSGFVDKGDGLYEATYTVGVGDIDQTSGGVPVSVVLEDGAGNANEPYATVETNDVEIDAHEPVLVSAVMTSENTIEVTFSEDLKGSTPSNADFVIDGYALTSPDAKEVSPGVVLLTSATSFVGAVEKIKIAYNNTASNGVKDLAGNTAPSAEITIDNSYYVKSAPEETPVIVPDVVVEEVPIPGA